MSEGVKLIKEVIGVGENEIEALADARKQLGLGEDDSINFEVIQRAEKKKFGLFGGCPAKVKAWIDASPGDTAEDFLRNVLSAMKLTELTVDVEKDEKSAKFNIEGEDIGYVIGRRGETLDALQYLTSLVANHQDNSYFKIIIDTGNYREKREKTLEILGRKMAFKVSKTGKKVVLEPMNPYERRIIHTAVQKVNGVISESVGENANRHVVIKPDPKSNGFRRNNYNRNRGRRPYHNSKPQNAQATDAPKRKPINEGGEFGLYGRIDK